MPVLKNIVQFLKSINYLLILAWVLPISILLTILYLNFLPFGYEKTLTINVGTTGDDRGEFYLEKNSSLGARQSINDKNFRYLDGLAYAVYKPKAVLNNASIEATVEGEGISFIIPPDLENINWDYDWNAQTMAKDFEIQTTETNIYKRFKNSEFQTISSSVQFKPNKEFAIEVEWFAGTTANLLNGDISLIQTQTELILTYGKTEIKYPLPDFFMGKIQTVLIGFDGKNIYFFVDQIQVEKKTLPISINDVEIINIIKDQDTTALRLRQEIKPAIDIGDGCVYFDGAKRLVLPDTADKFEEGPFAIYAEWIPEVATDYQQIIGHYNWEILQNEKSVSFQVGRMSTSTGSTYKISYPIDKNFFNKKHHLLAIYSPAEENALNGYIELFVDNAFSGQAYFSDKIIWKNYGDQNLSLGWTPHNYNENPHLQGSICITKFTNLKLEFRTTNTWNFSTKETAIRFSLWGTGELNKIEIKVKK